MVNVQLEALQSPAHWCSLPKNLRSARFPVAKERTWVKLLEPLSPYSHDEALLLCMQSEAVWIAWIPDYGEAWLSIEQFCIEPSEND